MREESESGMRKYVRLFVKDRQYKIEREETTAEDGERGGSSDVRLKTVPQTSDCNRKCSVADKRPETLMRQNVVVVFV